MLLLLLRIPTSRGTCTGVEGISGILHTGMCPFQHGRTRYILDVFSLFWT